MFFYKEGLHAIHQPLLVLVGSKDEAFNAKAFINAVKNNSTGEVYIIKGATHDGILESNDAIKHVKTWAEKFDFIKDLK